MTLRMRLADLRGRGLYAGYPNASRCIFIHVPKTGGTSVVRTLFGQNSRHVACIEYERANPFKFRTFFKFCFVRNPWDRLVSTYFFLRRGGSNEADRAWAEANLARFGDFDLFVRDWLTPANAASWVHFAPQCDFICDAGGVVAMDFVGRYERLQEDFARVAARLQRPGQLAEVNRGCHGPYASYYDDETRGIVAQVYARDICLLGYDFDRI